MMTFTKVDSSMIDLVGYDEKDRVLAVRFVNAHVTYCYFNVPKKIYRGLLEASSKGLYMNDHIIDFYEYTRMSGRKARH